jgi:hypothetical protein
MGEHGQTGLALSDPLASTSFLALVRIVRMKIL